MKDCKRTIKTDLPQAAFYFTKITIIFLSIIISILFPSLSSISLFATSTSDTNKWKLQMNVENDAYLVVDAEKNNILFSKNEKQQRPGPLAVNLMLSILTCENLNNKSQITASQQIADLSKKENNYQVRLQAGNLYEPNYLLYCMLYYDSKAAAALLAENVVTDKDNMIPSLNNRGRALGLDNTVFSLNDSGILEANTDMEDTMRLLLHANTLDRFTKVFNTQSEIFFGKNNQNPQVLENRMSPAWSWSNGTVKGATIAHQDYFFSAAYFVAGSEFNIFVLQASNQNSTLNRQELIREIIQESYSVSEEVFGYYERVPLVKKGDHCRKIVQQDNVEIDLVYLDNIYYIRPVEVADYTPSSQLSLSNLIPLPVDAGERLGQMIFIMPDGARYVAGVGSPETIVSKNTHVDSLFVKIQSYPQIVYLIAGLIGLLLLSGASKLIYIIVTRSLLKERGNKNHFRR